LPEIEHITIEPDTLRDGRKAYLLHCRSAGLAHNTILNYERVTGVFVQDLEQRGVRRLAELSPDHLRAWFLDLQAVHNKGGVHVYYRPVKAMLRWLWDEYERETRNPIERVKVESSKVKPMQGIPMDDFSRMVAACHGKYKLRDQALLYALLDTCCRATEFCKLRVLDVNYVTGRCWVEQAKGDKSRAVRLGDKSLRALRRYLKTRGELRPNDPLFERDEGGPFDRFGLRSLMRRRSTDAGCPCPGLHDFRRRGAYLLWKKTRDLKAISEYLGHSSPIVTLRYLATDEEDTQDMHRAGSPVDYAGG
jgi:integrase/recombinase XerD